MAGDRMNHFKRNLAATVLGVLLVACVVASLFTVRPDAPRGTKKATHSEAAVDESMLNTARKLSAEARTVEEHDLAQRALSLADNAVTQDFAIAMRETALAPAPASTSLKEINRRIAELREKVAETKAQVEALAKAASKDEESQAKLDLGKAQLVLDQEELAEAQADLARQGGDRRANLERLLKSYQASQKTPPPAWTVRGETGGHLMARLEDWWSLRATAGHLAEARQQAVNKFGLLANKRQRLTHDGPPTAEEETDEEAAAAIARLRRLSDLTRILTSLNQGMQDAQLLADTYRGWEELVAVSSRAALHGVFVALIPILAVLMLVAMTGAATRHVLRKDNDRRRAQQMRLTLTIAAQIVGALIVAMLVFGPPTQISTMIGLATAGLTVVLKDFIVAFFGWFVLMGKNGIRIGDWVEIEGVGGEVVEIGLLKTVLLEMGNWTSTGHPTGRRVSFVNKFAIERHFFNFSTAGQWLWDELEMTLPPTADAYDLAMKIREKVDAETAADARLAEHDWERVTRQYETSAFSARPAVDLRPSMNGLVVVVRYITRASQRYDVKSQLFQAIVGLIHKPAGEQPLVSPPQPSTAC